jgi:hypothetical protein
MVTTVTRWASVSPKRTISVMLTVGRASGGKVGGERRGKSDFNLPNSGFAGDLRDCFCRRTRHDNCGKTQQGKNVLHVKQFRATVEANPDYR